MEDGYYGPLPPPRRRGQQFRREDGPYPSNSFAGRYNDRDYENREYYYEPPTTRIEDPRRSWRDYRQDEEEEEDRWGGGRSSSSYFDKGSRRTRKDPRSREDYLTLDRDEPVPSTSWKPRSYSKTRNGDRRQRFDYEEDRYEDSALPPYNRRPIPSPYDDRAYLYRPSERQDIFTSPSPPRPQRNGVVITPLAVPSLFDTLMGARSASPFASSLGLLSTLNSMRSMMMMSMNSGMPNFEVGGPASEAEIQPLLDQAEDILNDDNIAVAALGSDIRILQVISSSYSQQASFSPYDVGSSSMEQLQLQVGIQGSLGESGMALLLATGGRLEQIRLQTSDGREVDVPVRSRLRGYRRSKAPNNSSWQNRRSRKKASPVDSSEDVEIVDAEVISDYQDNGETRQGYERDGSRFSSWGEWRGPNRRDHP